MKKNRGKFILLSGLFLFLSLAAGAQTRVITGQVSDLSGPLPGAGIVIKGTGQGTTADIDGHYRITLRGGERYSPGLFLRRL